jgi:hypothetical protein
MNEALFKCSNLGSTWTEKFAREQHSSLLKRFKITAVSFSITKGTGFKLCVEFYP